MIPFCTKQKRPRAAGHMKVTNITTPEMAEINNVSMMQKAEVFMATDVLIFTNTNQLSLSNAPN